MGEAANPNLAFIDRGVPFVLAAAGGGSTAAAELLAPGGMSGCLGAVHLLQHRAAIAAYLGGEPDAFAALDCAEALAVRAFRECRDLAGPDAPRPFGVGVAAALATLGQRAGRRNRAHVVVQSAEFTRWVGLEWPAAAGRPAQEASLADWIRDAICYGAGLWSPQARRDPGPVVAKGVVGPEEDGDRAVFLGEAPHNRPDGPGAILCTAANPLHAAHLAMIRAGHRWTGRPVDVEVCLRNARKPPLGYRSMALRRAGCRAVLAGEPAAGRVFLSNLGHFRDKWAAWDGVDFLIGMDTFNRLDEPAWPAKPNRFSVFPRLDPAGNPIAAARPVDGPFFRVVGFEPSPLSSTEIRRADPLRRDG